MRWIGERLRAGVCASWRGAVMYVGSPVLLVLALVPTGVRTAQVLDAQGLPEGSLISEAVVGVFRIGFACAALAVAAGWRPLKGGGLRPPSLAGTGAAWSEPGFSWVALGVDLLVYGALYGGLNFALAAVSGQGLFGVMTALGPDQAPDVTTTLIVFVAKNLVVIPVATIHMLWALRLLQPR